MSEEVLITGGSGFLGKEVCSFFDKKKINYKTLGRAKTNDLICDLGKESPNISNFSFETVIHIAGKAHSIPKSKVEEQEFYRVNVEGTKRLLESLINKPKRIFFISTVAVYGLDKGSDITEDFPLKGNTPYARSKILAEKEIEEFGYNNNINIVIVRLPLISGKDAIGNLGAMVSAIKKGFYFRIGNGNAKRSLVASSDIGPLILKMKDNRGVYNVTDGINPSIKEIDTFIGDIYNKKIRTLPNSVIILLAKFGDVFSFFPLTTLKYTKLTNSLTFSNKKILSETEWKPSYSLNGLKDNN